MMYLAMSVRLYVRPSVHPSVPFPIENLFTIFYSNFENILLSGMSGMGWLIGKIRPFLTELLSLFILKK